MQHQATDETSPVYSRCEEHHSGNDRQLPHPQPMRLYFGPCRSAVSSICARSSFPADRLALVSGYSYRRAFSSRTCFLPCNGPPRPAQPTHTALCQFSHGVYTGQRCPKKYKKLSYRRGITRRVVSVEILPIVTQQCRNYLYDNS